MPPKTVLPGSGWVLDRKPSTCQQWQCGPGPLGEAPGRRQEAAKEAGGMWMEEGAWGVVCSGCLARQEVLV